MVLVKKMEIEYTLTYTITHTHIYYWKENSKENIQGELCSRRMKIWKNFGQM